jgi:hypothetical protein
MQTITQEYLKGLEILPTERMLDMETDALRSLYRYEDKDAQVKFAAFESARAWQPNTMFMYFEPSPDKRSGKFINPLDVTPAFDKAPSVCRLDLELNSLHVDDLIRKMSLSRKQPLEHRLAARAPVTLGAHRDWADWLVCSAIDVFAEKDAKGRDKRLQSFVDDNQPTLALGDQEAIQIEGGRIKLSHGVWGHTKSNVFLNVFRHVTNFAKSPMIAAAGLPAMVPAVAAFAHKVVSDYTSHNKLEDLWQTKTLDFRISEDAKGTFTLRPGFWTVIDTDYVKANPDLEGHKIDFEFGSFEILDANDEPIDAAYVVNKIHLEPQTTVH